MNPFAPGFGVSPPLLVGRDDIIDDFIDALDAGPGAPERAMLITGLRGTGKTVMLNALEDAARTLGWEVISETATPGLLERIVSERLPALLATVDPKGVKRTITGAGIAGLGDVEIASEDQHPLRPGLRAQAFQAAELLHERSGGGLLVTVDEVHRKQIGDLREIGAVVQHAFREGRQVAFVAAGLPSAVSDLLNDDVSTFLRRADRRHLGAVSPEDVRRALHEPIQTRGHDITDEALDLAVAGTGGYPFMIQLVGWHTWRCAKGADVLDIDAARNGTEKAARKVGSLVHEPALRDLSDIDRSFLVAMASDDGASRVRDIAQRLDVEASYAGVYRRRLLDSQMIYSPKYGYVDYTMPSLRQYLRDHAANTRWGAAL